MESWVALLQRGRNPEIEETCYTLPTPRYALSTRLALLALSRSSVGSRAVEID